MAPRKISPEVHKETDQTSDSSEDDASDTSASSSDADTDSSDSDDGEQEHDLDVEMDISSPATQISEDKQSKHTGEKTPQFKLTCLQDWDNEQFSTSLKKHLEERRKKRVESASIISVAGPRSANFNPWWDAFTKSRHRKAAVLRWKSTQKQDDDTYESWFKNPPKEGTSWLCGPGPSTSSTASRKSKVEDIEVPSIYDKKPSSKGRRALKRERKAEREKTLGKQWFGMKAPDVDDKLRNDMELIQMRGVLDPKRFYKHQDRKALPKYFQMGTVVDEGTDFYSSRLTKKQRKQTLVEELMADANIRQYNKRKYGELQQKMRAKKKFKNKKK